MPGQVFLSPVEFRVSKTHNLKSSGMPCSGVLESGGILG